MVVSIDRLVYLEAVSLSVIILMIDSVIFTVLGLVLSVNTLVAWRRLVFRYLSWEGVGIGSVTSSVQHYYVVQIYRKCR